jgi:hypothetical protein
MFNKAKTLSCWPALKTLSIEDIELARRSHTLEWHAGAPGGHRWMLWSSPLKLQGTHTRMWMLPVMSAAGGGKRL